MNTKLCPGANARVTTDTERHANDRVWARCSECGRKVRVVVPSLAAMKSNKVSGSLYAMHRVAAEMTVRTDACPCGGDLIQHDGCRERAAKAAR